MDTTRGPVSARTRSTFLRRLAASAAFCTALVAPWSAHADPGWTWIASEWQAFSVAGTQTVRYGSGTSWVTTSVTGAGQCTNEFFGRDPAYGIAKQCEVAVPDSGTGWSRIATEWQSFSVSGMQTVRYGSGASWITKSVTGGGQCTNDFFGADPAYGVVKQCEVAVTDSGTAWTWIAAEWQPFNVSGTQTVRYGTGTSWVTRQVSGGGQCTNEFFGTDPAYGFRKECQVAGGPVPAPAQVPAPIPSPGPTLRYGLEWPGDGSVRRMLYWSNPFPIYDATYIFKVYPRKKIVPANSPTGYYTTFFWGNNGNFVWDNGNPNTYYGAHPYPIPAPDGPGEWEISVRGTDIVTGDEVTWNRWYTQAFRAWRESPCIAHHEFYWDLPDLGKVLRYDAVDCAWATQSPPNPAIVMGQAPDYSGASWGGYPGWEEFNGILRGIQLYAGLLSVPDILAELAAPQSTPAGARFMWYLNVDPRPSDVDDKKAGGTPHHPRWDGTTAFEWSQWE